MAEVRMTCLTHTPASCLCPALPYSASREADPCGLCLLGSSTGWLQVGFGHWEAPGGEWRSGREGEQDISSLILPASLLPITTFLMKIAPSK